MLLPVLCNSLLTLFYLANSLRQHKSIIGTRTRKIKLCNDDAKRSGETKNQ